MELLFRSFTALNQAGRISSCRFALLCPAQVSHSKFGFATITVDSKRKNKKLKTIPPPEDPLPIYVQSRLDIWTKLKAQQDELIAQKPRDLLTVTLPDGKKVEGLTWETNPLDVAKTLSNSLANEVVVAKVNGQLWDLERPFEEDSTLHLLKFSEPEAKAVFWNSAAFVLGESLERAYGVQNNGLLATVASIENGLYCDVHVEKKTLTVKHFPEIESKLVRSRYTKNVFERLEVDKNNLLEMFAYNKFRIDEINEKIADGAKAIVYRCGIFIDICQLPHVRYNKRVKAFKLRTIKSVNWKNQKDGEKLYRVHGIAFQSDSELKEWIKVQAGRK